MAGYDRRTGFVDACSGTGVLRVDQVMPLAVGGDDGTGAVEGRADVLERGVHHPWGPYGLDELLFGIECQCTAGSLYRGGSSVTVLVIEEKEPPLHVGDRYER